jgi:hypothetical protein
VEKSKREELVYGGNFIGDCPVYKMDNGEFMVSAGPDSKSFKTEYEAVKYSQMLTTRVTGCAAVCAIRVDPLVMRF